MGKEKMCQAIQKKKKRRVNAHYPTKMEIIHCLVFFGVIKKGAGHCFDTKDDRTKSPQPPRGGFCLEKLGTEGNRFFCFQSGQQKKKKKGQGKKKEHTPTGATKPLGELIGGLKNKSKGKIKELACKSFGK